MLCCCSEIDEEERLPSGRQNKLPQKKYQPDKKEPTPVRNSSPPKEIIEEQVKAENQLQQNTSVTSVESDWASIERNPSQHNHSDAPSVTYHLETNPPALLRGQDFKAIMSQEKLLNAVQRLEAVASRLETLSTGSSSSSSRHSPAPAEDIKIPPFVIAFDAYLNDAFRKYMELSGKIGGVVKSQADQVKDAFDAQRYLLVVAAKSKKPDMGGLQKLLTPLSSKITAVQDLREKNRPSEFFNHLSAVSECIGAAGWVSVEPTPVPFVKDMSDSGQFFLNRVLKDFKEKDQVHVLWVKSVQAFLSELQAYIKQHHTTGVTWNSKGGDAMSAAPSAGAPPPPPSGGPPPPPPPPPPSTPAETEGGDDSRNELLKSLCKGTDITKGLKKVSNDMKTHKNPALRLGPAPFKPVAAPKPFSSVKPVTGKSVPDKPPVFELEGKKWIVEYQKDRRDLVIGDAQAKQVIYMYKCQGSTLQVKNKINSIVLDNCKKCAIVLEDVIAGVEFVNCQSMQCQINGKASTVSIDKTDGCQVFLSKESMAAEIVTAKSSEMNVLLPQADGEFKEYALPEQYKTKWNGKTFATSATESV